MTEQKCVRTYEMNHIGYEDNPYVYQLGKNELVTARIIAEAEKFLKEGE